MECEKCHKEMLLGADNYICPECYGKVAYNGNGASVMGLVMELRGALDDAMEHISYKELSYDMLEGIEYLYEQISLFSEGDE